MVYNRSYILSLVIGGWFTLFILIFLLSGFIQVCRAISMYILRGHIDMYQVPKFIILHGQ